MMMMMLGKSGKGFSRISPLTLDYINTQNVLCIHLISPKTLSLCAWMYVCVTFYISVLINKLVAYLFTPVAYTKTFSICL